VVVVNIYITEKSQLPDTGLGESQLDADVMGHFQVGGGGYIYHRWAPRQGSKSILLKKQKRTISIWYNY
jgi:hypothetical protein